MLVVNLDVEPGRPGDQELPDLGLVPAEADLELSELS